MILLTGATRHDRLGAAAPADRRGRAGALPRARPAPARRPARAGADRARRPGRPALVPQRAARAWTRSSTWRRRSATSRAASIEELNAVATLRLVRAAERAGARRFVFFSAMGAEPPLAHALLPRQGAGRRRRSRPSALETMVFSPSIVYTPGDPWLTLLERFSYLPAIPVSGSGRALLPADLGRGRGRLRDGGADGVGAAPALLRAGRPGDALLRRDRARGARGRPAAAGRCCTCRCRWCAASLRALRRWPAPRSFATWEEAELMEEPMTTPRGTADAEALGVRPLPMASVLGGLERREPRRSGALASKAEPSTSRRPAGQAARRGPGA